MKAVLLVSGLEMMTKLWRKEMKEGQARCWKVRTRSKVVRTDQHHLLLLMQVVAMCWVSPLLISVTTGDCDLLIQE